MKLICEIELPDNADCTTILDAMAQAGRDESKWRRVESREALMKQTSLDNKCGSCKFFEIRTLAVSNSKCYGDCKKGRARYRQRTCPACKLYERKTKT
jgi:hypothetical protein